MTVTELRREATLVAHVHSPIDAVTGESISWAAEVALSSARPRLVLDLRDAESLDWDGLRALRAAHRRMASAGGRIELHHPNAVVRQTLAVNGVDITTID